MTVFDWFIIITYLVGLLLFGIFYHSNTNNFEEFSVGKRNYGIILTTCTLFASLIGGGSTLGLATKVYDVGIIFILIPFASAIRQLFIAQFLVYKIRKRSKNAISLGDIMEHWYGKYARIISGLAAVILNIAYIGAQVGATGFMFEIFLDINFIVGAFIAMGIMIIYSTTGGIHSVVITDAIQAVILTIAIPIIAYFSITYLGGPIDFVNKIPTCHLEGFGLLGGANLLNLFITIFIGGALFPAYIQRLLLTDNIHTAKQGTIFTALLSFPLYIIIGIIGLAAVALNNSIDPNYAMLDVIKTVCPPGVLGIVIAGLLAIMMSTADTSLNSASIALTQDILKPLFGDQKRTWLGIAKITNIVIGFTTVACALFMDRIIDLVFASFNFWGPIMIMPLLAGFYNFKIPKKLYLFATIVSIMVTFIWLVYYAAQSGVSAVIIGTFIHYLIYQLYFINKKWFRIKANPDAL